MNNNPGYRFPPSNSSGSFSSFSSPYSSTPTNNMRFQRPRFGYAGPPSYPRPRSSASKPNPAPYEDEPNFGYNNESMDNSSIDYSHGYLDSMKNNYGDTSLHLNDSLNMNSRDPLNNSSAYFTCNESFYDNYDTPLKPDYPNANLSYGSSKRGGHSSFPSNPSRVENLNTNVGGPALYNNNSMGLSNPVFQGVTSSSSVFHGLAGTFATSTTRGVLNQNTRGKRGTFGQKRGNTRGRFQKKKQIGRGGSRFTGSDMPLLRSTWRCDVCNLVFTSQIPLDMHLRGSKHAKKLKSQNAFSTIQSELTQIKEIEKPDGKKFYCEICCVVANSSVQLQMHLEGVKHQNKLAQSAKNKEIAELEMLLKENAESGTENVKTVSTTANVKTDSTTANVKTDSTTANVKTDSTTANVKTEQNGKSNGRGGVRRLAPADFSEPPSKVAKFACDTCNVIVNSDMQLQQHLSSKKHQAKVEGKPIIRKGRPPKKDVESAKPVQTTTVVGVKTLSSSFVKGDAL